MIRKKEHDNGFIQLLKKKTTCVSDSGTSSEHHVLLQTESDCASLRSRPLYTTASYVIGT